MSVSLEELNRRRPGVDETGIRAFAILLQTREILAVLVGEPELASHQAVPVFGFLQVGEHLAGVVVERIDVIDWELSLDARAVFAHREVHARLEGLPVCLHFHVSGKGLDVERERLQRHFIHACPLVFLCQELARLVGSALRIAATLILLGGQLLHHTVVARQILRVSLQSKGKQNN